MDRGIKNLFRRSLFDDLAGSHHIHSGAQCCNDPHIVADNKKGGAGILHDSFQEMEDLDLDCRVQRGRRLIRDNDPRLAGEGNGNGSPLAHPPGKLEGILSHPKLRSADPRHIQQFFRPLLSLPPGTFSMDADGLRDLASDLYRGVQAVH